MFNLSTLKTALTGYIGFKDFDDPAIGHVATALRSSVSGQYFSDFHPLLRSDNLYYAHPEDLSFDTWLQERLDSSVNTLFSKLAAGKKIGGSTRSIFDNLQLFTGSGPLSDTITKSGRLVGLAITPRNVNNIQVVLDQIGFQFSAAQTRLPVYLWHSSRVATVDSYSLTTFASNKFTWKPIGFTLDYVNYAQDIDAGGTWFVGYFENDLTGNAVLKRYDFYHGPCSSCRNTIDDRNRFNLWSKYVDIIPFSVSASALSGSNLPDMNSMVYDETNNFGLNLSLSVKPDVTELITGNLSLIAYPLGLQFATDMLNWMLMNPSTRVNPSRINASQSALAYELSGDKSSNKKGLIWDTERAIEALSMDLSDLSAALPKNKPSGIRIGAI
jgi:hypothetical protein